MPEFLTVPLASACAVLYLNGTHCRLMKLSNFNYKILPAVINEGTVNLKYWDEITTESINFSFSCFYGQFK